MNTTVVGVNRPEAVPRWQTEQPIALVDLLDRVLAGGVVIAGDVTLSIAGIDLVQVSLRALITSLGGESDPLRPR